MQGVGVGSGWGGVGGGGGEKKNQSQNVYLLKNYSTVISMMQLAFIPQESSLCLHKPWVKANIVLEETENSSSFTLNTVHRV